MQKKKAANNAHTKHSYNEGYPQQGQRDAACMH